MRLSLQLLVFVGVILLLVGSLCQTYGQGVTEYKVQINLDNSASWTIIEASSANTTIDTWLGFQQRINNLVEAAVIQTQRNMSIDPNSFQMTLQEASIEYQFTWLNFSQSQPEKITFGDVFKSSNFFNNFYGDGIIQVTFPSNYKVQSVSPPPNQRDDSQHFLEWLGTQNFVTGNPNLTLIAFPIATSPSPDQTSNSLGQQLFPIVGIGLATLTIVLFVTLYLIRRRKKRTTSPKKDMIYEPLIESEEEKILKIIRSSGGQIFQSSVTEQSRFSKAKASQLLTALEKKGIVTRYKKGRDKIVTLTEKGKDGSP
jgi:uncharacterized membrane protein